MKRLQIDLVNQSTGRFSVMTQSDRLYEKIEPDLPDHLKQIEESCYIGDYTIFKPEFSLEEFIQWCNGNGIDVLVRHARYNKKYMD